MVHTPGRERIFPPRSVDTHYGSVLDPAALAAAFYDVEAVVHLVAIIRQHKGATFQSINQQGVANVVAAARSSNVKHFIQVSAIGATRNQVYRYLYSKWLGEQEVMKSGLPFTIFRPSIMFGQGDEFVSVLAGLVRLFPLVPVIGPGKNRFQPVAVEDVARCIGAAVDRETLKGKTIEIGGPEQISYNDIVGAVSRTLGKRRVRAHVPVWLMWPMAAAAQKLLPRPPLTTDQLRMVSLRNVAERRAVEENFGFTPRSLEGNIDFVKSISWTDGLRMALGAMPSRIRDH